MAKLSRERMREYQRERRARLEYLHDGPMIESVYQKLLRQNQAALKRYEAMQLDG